MSCRQLCLLLSLCVTSKGLLLVPYEKAVICQGEQLELTCTTNATFLRWILSLQIEHGTVQTYSRYISLTDVTQQASSWVVNSTSFNVSRVSHQGKPPLVSRLLIDPVTIDLNGTKVNCTEVDTTMNNPDIAMVMASTIINVIGEGSYSTKVVITSTEYGSDNATVFLGWAPESQTLFNISSKPQVGVTLSLLSAQLTVPYNTHHNVSIVATSCQQYTTTTIIELHYVKCKYPFQANINDSQSVQLMGYVDPSLEGTMVNFSCPTGQILIGPTTSTCMENGEWESDPIESNIKCKVNCGPPLLPPNGFIILSNDTIEGSSMLFICLTSHPETVYTTVCNLAGVWEPHPVDVCSANTATAMLDAATLVMVSSISVFILTSITFFLFGYACRCRQRCEKLGVQTLENRPVYENVVPQLTTEQVDLELTRNEAYESLNVGLSRTVIT